jgi:hypothetical protein
VSRLGLGKYSFVTPSSILGEMPRQWHVDGSELNYELDGIFASVSATELS